MTTSPVEPIVSHTPGPWRVRSIVFSGEDVLSHGVAHGDGSTWILLPTTHNEANARLIAAAPDGLEAAHFALSVLRANPIEMSERMAIERLEAFIAKAEGRS